jgi:electron transfer flavoprotein alpha subunit
MADMLAFAEARGGELRKVALETVTAARNAADATGGGAVAALLIGAPGIGNHASALAKAGADRVLLVEHEALANCLPEVFAATAAKVLGDGGFRAAFFAASAEGRDLAPRVAAKLKVSMAADVTGFAFDGDAMTASHPVYIGKAIVTERLTGTPAIVTLRPGAIDVAESPKAGTVEHIPPAMDPASARVRVKETVEQKGAALDLGEAPVIVSGGRGLRAAENFKLVEELAAAFGNAAVGATRAVTDDGWRPATDQIGQTGRVVSPDLYVAVGISGAVQHLAGMRTSRGSVASNRARDAPICKIADYGIVGDLFEVVPRLTEEIKRAKG